MREMVSDALSSHEPLIFIIDESKVSSTTYRSKNNYDSSDIGSCSSAVPPPETTNSLAVQGRKKRRKRPKACKNKEEAETQRTTHIAVERNRRRQMNEHLAMLRSLMPDSYVQRGDQASIVGGAIEFVKELEHILQSLEANKSSSQLLLEKKHTHLKSTTTCDDAKQPFPPNTHELSSCSRQNPLSSKYTSHRKAAAIADVQVTLIEAHASIRIVSGRRVRQLSKLVAAFHSLFLNVLHLNLTTSQSFILYSISAKVEEGSPLSSAEDISAALHHMLRILIEE